MSKRLLYGLGGLLLLVCTTLVVWQGSFDFGDFYPKDAQQTFVFYGISTLIFLLMVTLGFMLVRLIVKLWIERRGGVGSRIRTKLVFGALVISLMPVFFMVLFSVYVLSRTLEKWFTRPTEHEHIEFVSLSKALSQQTQDKADAEAELLAFLPATQSLLAGEAVDHSAFQQFCVSHGLLGAKILPADGEQPVASYGVIPGTETGSRAATARASVRSAGSKIGTAVVAVAVPINVAEQQKRIQAYDQQFIQIRDQKKRIRNNYLQLLTLIALFILFVSSWLAQFLARQISGPMAALLHAAEEVSKGNLAHRIDVKAIDELARLVDGFNRMTSDLEANRSELEARRRFTEAILESIPTGVISVDSSGAVLRVNKALQTMFPDVHPAPGARLEDLFSREDAAEIRYLMNRARRTGLASQQLETKTSRGVLHLATTVSALEGRGSSGYVIVLEDTSDLLRAQKSAAWSEVARRVAHEIKNPLTPITLSAERIIRQTGRAQLPEGITRIVVECADIILNETASVKRLVDEFSEFSRMPAPKPVLCDLNDVISNGLGIFDGRLDSIDLKVDLAPGLPPVFVDPEQFKRVVVNLVDNAAEAMQQAPSRILTVQTRPGLADVVEIVVADSGCGITPEQKEKLFLPYFSTKSRGTGLGLAIVSHILAEHNASIRVDDNRPSGARFTIEVPVAYSETLHHPVITATIQA